MVYSVPENKFFEKVNFEKRWQIQTVQLHPANLIKQNHVFLFKAQAEKFFKMVTDNYWAWRQLEEPELATSVNNYKYNDRLESFNYTVFRDRLVRIHFVLLIR